MNSVDKENISNKIKERRIELGYSYQDLANATGLSRSTLNRYESGEISNIPAYRLKDIATALHVDVNYFMSDVAAKEKPTAESSELKSTTKEILSIVENLPEDLQKVAVEQMRALAAASKFQDKQ